MEKKKNISGIHNYCDKWCERCKFTSQCAIYDPNDNLENLSDEEFFEDLHQIFADTLEMIKETIEEAGEDWDTFVEEANEMEIKEPEFTAKQKIIIELSEKYHKNVTEWFVSNKDYLKSKEVEYIKSLSLGVDIEEKAIEVTEAIDTIDWYLIFITVKIIRSFSGLNENKDDIPEEYREDPIQNDHNGTAKIAKIAIEKSLAAWAILHKHFAEKADKILDFLVILNKIKEGLIAELPDMDKFIRPGFDE